MKPILLTLAAFALGSPLCWADLSLVSPDGAAPVVVLSAKAEDQERMAVEDLRHYLGRVVGQEIAVVESAPEGRVAIHVGQVPGNEALGSVVEEKKLGRDGFVLDVTSDSVRIVGGSKFGTAYGVFELLERLGVRWLFPGEWGEVVPKTERPTLPEGRFTDKPAFSMRQMHIAWVGDDAGEWFRRQRHNRSGFYGHSGLINPKTYGQAHPEWYAEIDGVRKWEDPHFKLCHSNNAMVEQAIADTLKEIRKREADRDKETKHIGYRHSIADYSLISISPTDGGGFCRCAECLEMGTISDRLQIFANRVAEGVRKEFPHYSVGYYGAYSEAQMPPTVKAGPGVVVFATTWVRNFFQPLESMSNNAYRKKIEEFTTTSPRLAIRDFDGLSVWWGYSPLSLVDVHGADYPWYHKHGVEGIITEAQNAWGPWGYSYYLTGKLMWNPWADRAALKRDFVRTGYAEAAEPMQRYYERLDKAVVYPDARTRYAMRQDLEEAGRLVRDPGARARVDTLRAYFWAEDLVEKFRAGNATPEEVETLGRVVASLDRHATAFTNRRMRRLGLKLDENATPLPPAEMEALLASVKLEEPGEQYPLWPEQEDLRLVPYRPEGGEFDPAMKVAPRFGPTTLLIYAKAGERIRVKQKWARGEAFQTSFDLNDPELQVVAEGLATGAEIVDYEAGSEGIYRLTFSPGGSYPDIFVENRYAVFRAGDVTQRLHPMGRAAGLWFYVPKGTKHFSFGAKAYEPLRIRVHGPEGAGLNLPEIRQSAQQFLEHRVEVPEGADGKPWRVDFNGGKKEIYLKGVPPYLSASPERLLVPTE